MQGTGCHSVTRNDRVAAMAGVDPDAAVLLVQKYGVETNSTDPTGTSDHCPEKFKRHYSIEQRLLDYMHVVSHLERHAEWWNGQLTLLGGSEGAVTASLGAVLIPRTDRLVAFSYGPARTLREALPATVEKQMRAGGAPAGAIEAQLGEIREKMAEMKSNPSPEKSMGSESTTYKWWASALDIRSVLALKQLEIPILLLHGRLDMASDVTAARDAVETLKAAGRVNVAYIEYEELNHVFQDSAGDSHLQEVVNDIRTWLAETGAGTESP